MNHSHKSNLKLYYIGHPRYACALKVFDIAFFVVSPIKKSYTLSGSNLPLSAYAAKSGVTATCKATGVAIGASIATYSNDGKLAGHGKGAGPSM